MNGKVAYVSKGLSKEDLKLQEFKARVKDLIQPNHDDYYLKKWLKARCYDVTKAEKMFRESMAYRKKMELDTLLDEYTPPKVLEEYLAGGFCGFDKQGSPVRVERYGYLDMRGLMHSTKVSDLEKTKLLQCEYIVKMWKEQSERLGRRVDGLTVIFDMENAGAKQMWKPGLQMYLHLVKLLEDNYPEMMKRLLVVNAPKIFPILWKLGRPLVSEDMKEKIRVLGSDYYEALTHYIDPDNIPAYLGGKLTDPDGNPLCKTMICHGGIVPTSYYISECGDTEGTEVVTIRSGDQLEIEFIVEKPGSLIRWEFRTEDYDIGFGLQHRNGSKNENIIPIQRFSCNHIIQDGSQPCEKRGIYVIIFDNHYSWTREKVLHYLIELFTPDETVDEEVALMSCGSWTRLSHEGQVTHL